MPSGQYLMEDFCYAGGLPAVLRALAEDLHADAITVTGKTIGENNAEAAVWNSEVIRPDVAHRRIHLDVPDDQLAQRRAEMSELTPQSVTGYQRLYVDHVLQADRGADFDFLIGCRGSTVRGHNH